ncbi:MAG TPA: M23 family metallopeptidase [Terracidiphilus sp.]|nr:M23 family metallopeptidase [Terracidiphilus sp.]
MTGSRLTRLALCLALLPAAASVALAQSPPASPAVSLTPATVVAGSPELLRVDAPATAAITGDWLGRSLQFFRDRNAWFALAGADVEAPIGPSILTLRVTLADGTIRSLSRTIDILPAHYRTTTLSVAPRFTEPTPAQLKQIESEIQLKKELFATSAPRRLWHGSFRAPVRATPTASFGTRRLFNGELKSVHKGMDFRARTGTPVRASNAGIVILAQPLYFEGNCVVIDHGLGLYTIAMHLSRIRVRPGQHVATGQLLGLSGATGRVTGPHLHWAVRWQGAYLDPAKLLRMNLAALR